MFRISARRPGNSTWMFFFLFLLVFIGIASLPSCNKPDIIRDAAQASIGAQFFFTSPGTSPLIRRVGDEIKRRDERAPFVNDFARKNGYPVWDKAMIFKLGLNESQFYNEIAISIGDQNTINQYLGMFVANATECSN